MPGRHIDILDPHPDGRRDYVREGLDAYGTIVRRYMRLPNAEIMHRLRDYCLGPPPNDRSESDIKEMTAVQR